MDITGKLMHRLVLQPVTPSPHAEYLGITYFDVSNADRSSALGLRLNQQNKMNTHTHKKILCDRSNVRSFVQSVQLAPNAEVPSSSPGGAEGWYY